MHPFGNSDVGISVATEVLLWGSLERTSTGWCNGLSFSTGSGSVETETSSSSEKINDTSSKQTAQRNQLNGITVYRITDEIQPSLKKMSLYSQIHTM